MTVALVGITKRYIGVSSDTKPTVGVPPASTFYETDTFQNFVYDGSAWSAKL